MKMLLFISGLIFLVITPFAYPYTPWTAIYDSDDKTMNKEFRQRYETKGYQVFDTLYHVDKGKYFNFVKKNNTYSFIKFSKDSKEEEVIPLADTLFKVTISLYERKIILEDTNHDLTLIFPIAPGGIDILRESSSTPRFKTAYITKSTIISKRYKPAYYQGLPFLRIMTDPRPDIGWTGIGLHIKQRNKLIRNFDSHGCIRLRKWDLMTVHALIKYGPQNAVKTYIVHNYKPELNHPSKIYNEGQYQRVKRFYLSSEKYESRRGAHGLTIFEKIVTGTHKETEMDQRPLSEVLELMNDNI